MKILHVIPGIGKKSGGPSRSCQGLIAALCKIGVDAYLYSFCGTEPWVHGVRRLAVEGNNPTVDELKKFDLVHIHSIWDLRLHKLAKLCREARVPYVIAPRGMLEPWSLKQGWLKKRIARFLYQDNDLRHAAALHATAASEESQFRMLGFKNLVIVSPNGVNLPSSTLPLQLGAPTQKRRALFMSRMHEKKGVAELIEAWRRVVHEGWTLELVYTARNEEELAYEAKCKVLAEGDESIIFTGALDDEAKWEAYARASLFVLPTHSENFGIVVAEALWAGVPVITTKGTPWRELESNCCGWWIDIGVEPLTECLRSVLKTPTSTLETMGENGHALVERKYTWDAAVREMVEGYKEIVG